MSANYRTFYMTFTILPVAAFIAVLFAIAFNLNIWFGLFLAVWLIASITWLLINLGRKNDPSKWYDWFIGTPVVIVAYVWFLADRVLSRNEKGKN